MSLDTLDYTSYIKANIKMSKLIALDLTSQKLFIYTNILNKIK